MEETLSIGVRLTEDGGVEFFGLEEVNARLAAGQRVVRMKDGQVYLEALSEEGDEDSDGEEEGEAYALAGCEILVTFSGGASSNGRGGGGRR